ncbi:WxcM-like, C-terminal [Yersinia intermedia]|jgi:dTDP-4-dehydrorhamnose 3,5-epimerase-like enzyme|uniref:WxcM-like domain-containing protein n=1 Tax=Yersinia intermedia TaxID=631 RepID=A0ABX6F604_YERIN|nr:FdtA/QdtA family cupin domain-containing protein [Yersinia intermedia]EEQ20610.1 NDP-hexose isomerase [Yersinia intermedia ATCC 29909]MCW8114217.1 FdtA/QdtA family cupin domain-containing protein [Yersinia intermedia]MDA5480570.1 FdtA/QdtA family cupin domain-containing protein [Yersinia intermedia]MDA5516300.1 FdtA/QdtA family cupin domain-containing protein [Yersinia intermedia]OVZ73737.1 dTDP-6-deoxy-3,4-keto-hexulose isomerase [Yersinia intermedia]
MDVKLIQLQKHGDERGQLIALEETKNIPFSIKRVYYMFETINDVHRGFHAHYKLQQLAIPVRGACRIILDDGFEKIEVYLDNPAQGLAIEPMIWHEMYDFSDDCVLMVLADDFYDEADYIRNYDEFIREAEKNG